MKIQTLDSAFEDMIIITNHNWEIEYVNQYFEQIKGISEAQIYGKNACDLLFEEYGVNDEEIEAVIQSTGQWHKEYARLETEDSQRFFSLTINGIINDHGKIRHYVIVKSDVTKRKEAEELLKLERENFASLFYGAPMGMITVDENIHITRINDEASTIFHRKNQDMVGMSLGAGLVCYRNRNSKETCGSDEVCESCTFYNCVSQALNLNRSVRGIEFKHKFTSNSEEMREIWLRLSTVPMVVNKKRFVMIVIEDITNNKIMEKTLIENEKRLRLITDNMIDLIIQIDTKGKIIYVSPSVWHLLGYNPEAVLYRSIFEFIHPDDLEIARDNMKKRMITQSNFTVEIRVHKRDQNFAWLEASGNILKDENNRTSIVYVCRDVTEKRRVITAIRKAKEEAVAANKAKSEFLANMSHEIRTPMNGIIGMTNMTLMTELTDEQRENLKMVKNSAESLLKIINSILDFSKIEAGKITMDIIDFEPLPMVHKVFKNFKHLAVEKGLTFNLDTDPKMPRLLRGDPSRIVQVMNNLVANAIKFTEQGEVTIGTKVLGVDEAICNVEFRVQDTGIGIDENDYKKVFKSFSQVDGSITRRYGGTGLGLSISKQLVELMGGQITFKSQKNFGTAFSFTVPLEHSMQEQVNTVNTTIQIPDTHYSADVLLVEDDRINQVLARRLLEKQGHRVVIAGNGREAINALDDRLFDLILMDIQMPEMDGIEATLKIKSNPKTKKIPIVALTAYAVKGDQERFLSLGMDDYIPKPIDIKHFFKVIDKYVGEKYSAENALNQEVDALLNKLMKSRNRKNSLNPEEQMLFIKDLERYSKKLEEYIDQKDFMNIEKNAHFIKNIAGTGSFLELRKKAFKIEIMSRKENMDEIIPMFKELQAELSQIREDES